MSHYRYSGARPRPYLGSGDLENVQRHRDPSLASNSQQVRGIQFAEYKDDETLIRYNCTECIHVPTIQLRRRRLNNFSRTPWNWETTENVINTVIVKVLQIPIKQLLENSSSSIFFTFLRNGLIWKLASQCITCCSKGFVHGERSRPLYSLSLP